jgi:phospholipid/cholesterol/gamma-HCH transport system substrate-binding protein
MEDGDTIRDTVETGLVASLQGELMPVKDNINVLVTRLNKTIALLNGTLGDSLLQYQATSMGRIVTNVEVVTAQLASASKEIKSTVVSVRTTSDDLQKTLAILKQNERNINQILTNVNHVTDTLKQSLGPIRDNLNGTMTSIRDVLDRANRGEGNLGLLLKDEKLYRNLERTTEDLDRLLIDIRQHPSRYVHISLFGKKEKKDKP